MEKYSLKAIGSLLHNTKRIFRLIMPEQKGKIIAQFALSFASSGAGFVRSWVYALVINILVALSATNAIPPTIIPLLVLMVLAGMLPGFLNSYARYLSQIFQHYLEEKFDLLIVGKRIATDIATYESPEHNNLISKIQEYGVWRVRNLVERQFYLLQNCLEILIAVIVIGVSNWAVMLVVVAGTLPMLVAEARFGQQVWSIHDSEAETRRKYWSYHEHTQRLSSIVEIKLFQNITYFVSHLRDLFGRHRSIQDTIERRRFLTQFGTGILAELVSGAAIVWFAIAVINGSLLIGTFTFLFAAIGSLRGALSGLFHNLGRQYEDNLYITDLFRFLDIPAAIPHARVPVALPPFTTPEIRFENVSFTYPGSSAPVLKNINLTIPAGERFAIVGINGAGKTTLIKLLCRFYDPSEGTIFVGGKDLKTIDIETWYTQVGALFQEYAGYEFLVKDAIALGRTTASFSLRAVQKAAAESESDTFIRSWENGYDQQLGKHFTRGVEPSRGQWQKLALARVLYRDPRVYILDEPTASIDAEAEANIFEKLEKLSKDRTVILISHRFSTVRNANRICVLEDGCISELGSHEELLKNEKTYARLFRLQAKGYQ